MAEGWQDIGSKIVAAYQGGVRLRMQREQMAREDQESKLRQDMLKHALNTEKLNQQINARNFAQQTALQRPQEMAQFADQGGAQPEATQQANGPALVASPTSGQLAPREIAAAPAQLPGVTDPESGAQLAAPGVETRTIADVLKMQRMQQIQSELSKAYTNKPGEVTTIPALGSQPIASGGPPAPHISTVTDEQGNHFVVGTDPRTGKPVYKTATGTGSPTGDAWTRAFIGENGRPPTTAELDKHLRDTTQMRTTIVNAGKRSMEEDAIDAAAQSLAAGDLTRLKDIASLRGDQRLLIYNRAKQLNPKFNTAEVDRKIKMESDLSSSTNGSIGQQLQSFGTFLEHAGEASDTVNAIRADRTNSKLLNKPLNWWAANVSGDPSYQRFITSLEPVRKEFEGFLLGGRALYGEDRKSAEIILSDNSSPAQVQAALKQMAKTAKDRYNEINFRYKRTMGHGIEQPFSPEAMQGAQKMGLSMGAGVSPSGTTNPYR